MNSEISTTGDQVTRLIPTQSFFLDFLGTRVVALFFSGKLVLVALATTVDERVTDSGLGVVVPLLYGRPARPLVHR